MEEVEFNQKYWYDTLKMVTVVNPRAEDYVFGATIDSGVDVATGKLKNEQRTYKVVAGGQERLPGPIANMYLDQMAKLIAQDDKKFQYIIDFALKAEYYEKLIIDVEDLIQTYQPLPQYLEANQPKAKVEETAFEGKDDDGSKETPGAGKESKANAPSGTSRKEPARA